MPRSGKRRVLVLGGGWGGLTVARQVREATPDLEVVLLEGNPVFWSCPLSNKWLIDVVDTQFLMHSYTLPARKYGYTWIQTEVSDIDRSKTRVHTAPGHLDYDWLVVSEGIRVAYEPWFGNDQKAIAHTSGEALGVTQHVEQIDRRARRKLRHPRHKLRGQPLAAPILLQQIPA